MIYKFITYIGLKQMPRLFGYTVPSSRHIGKYNNMKFINYVLPQCIGSHPNTRNFLSLVENSDFEISLEISNPKISTTINLV